MIQNYLLLGTRQTYVAIVSLLTSSMLLNAFGVKGYGFYADSKDFSAIGGLLNPLTPGTGGATGGLDIKFLSVTNDDTATIVLELLKIYTSY